MRTYRLSTPAPFWAGAAVVVPLDESTACEPVPDGAVRAERDPGAWRRILASFPRCVACDAAPLNEVRRERLRRRAGGAA